MKPGTNFKCIHCGAEQVIDGLVTWSAQRHEHTCTECKQTTFITLRTCNHVLKRQTLMDGAVDKLTTGVACLECGLTIADRNLAAAGYAFVPRMLDDEEAS